MVVRSGVTPWRPAPRRAVPEASDHLVEDEQAARCGAGLAQRLEAGSGSTTPALWKTGSTITAAIVSPSRASSSRTPAASLYSRTSIGSRTAAGIGEAAVGVGTPPPSSVAK
jgi:hypothetical protein